MYRICIDYSRQRPLGPHWYGEVPQSVVLPHVPGSAYRFYPVLTLSLSELPRDAFAGSHLSLAQERLVLPQYFASDLTIEDLYFEFRDGGTLIVLRDAVEYEAARIPVYQDDVDHRPRSVHFERLPASQDPSSSSFDPEQLQRPHHQLGGAPYNVQPFDQPMACAECRKPMIFIAQVDNDRALRLAFEDSGVAYYWWCDPCKVLGCHVASA